MDWIDLTQDWDRCLAFVSVVMNIQIPHNAGIFLTSLEPVGFSKRTLFQLTSIYSYTLPQWSFTTGPENYTSQQRFQDTNENCFASIITRVFKTHN